VEVRVRLAEWVPPVGGALSRYTSTWEVHATGAHRPEEAEWCPERSKKQEAAEARGRGDAKQPRRRAGRQSARRGGGSGSDPLGRRAFASCVGIIGIAGSVYFWREHSSRLCEL
jgi:hypothetical protein